MIQIWKKWYYYFFSNSKNNCYIAPLDHVQFQDVHRRKLKVFNKKILFCLCPKFIFYACIRQFILQIKKLTNQKIVEKKPQGCEISRSITLVIYLQSRNEKNDENPTDENKWVSHNMTPWLKYMEDSQDLWNMLF